MTTKCVLYRLLCLGGAILPMLCIAGIRVLDDTGEAVVLEQPARRIISLAPHVTELLFAAGAGASVVAVSAYSNYPEQALSLPQISAGAGLDIERIVAMQPDLVIAWKSGNPATQVRQLERLGLQVFYSEPREIDAIAETLQRFGRLTGHIAEANEAALQFRKQVIDLRNEYQNKKPVTVFYQVWQKPLMTINGRHMINDWLELCGADNVFSDLPTLVPVVDTESVLAENPQMIVSGWYAGQDENWRDFWNRWSGLEAARLANLFTVPAENMDRQTPRALLAARELCEKVEQARQALNRDCGHAATAHQPDQPVCSESLQLQTEDQTGD